MITRYIIWLLGEVFFRILNYIFFPVAWMFRTHIRGNDNKPKILWWMLHDGNDYGDNYFLEKHGNKKNFWTAYKWHMRNPLHNYYHTHRVKGRKENYKGSATIQECKLDSGLSWRTLKTMDSNGVFKDKHGKWIDYKNSILGKQNITFEINGRKYFRWSKCTPKRLFGNIWYAPEYKFGFETYHYAIQCKPFIFKRKNKLKIEYDNIDV